MLPIQYNIRSCLVCRLLLISIFCALAVRATYGATATGGTITTNGSYLIHTFTSDGTFTVSGGSLVCDVLVVAGGGGGGSSQAGTGGAGGGGAGGLIYVSATLSSYNVNFLK